MHACKHNFQPYSHVISIYFGQASIPREQLIIPLKVAFHIPGKDVSTRDIVSSIISAANRKIQRKPRSKPEKKLDDKRSDVSPGGSPPSSPLTSPPHHLTTSLADYDGLNHKYSRTQDGNK